MTRFLAEEFGSIPLVGAEVGVLEGANASSMLTLLNIRKLYLVDPFEAYLHRSQEVMDEIRAFAMKHLLPWGRKIVWIELPATRAAGRVAEQLDFVYIDSPHDYESALLHMNAWWPRVKIGGYIGGHNYQDMSQPQETVRAVHTFLSGCGLTCRGYEYFNSWAAPGIPQCDWWARKGACGK